MRDERLREPALPATCYAVLGMLSMAPMSGYELAQGVDKSIANFWPISKSQVYAAVARLEGLGFVEGADVAQQGLPDKRTYRITGQGLDALDAWLDSPGYPPSRQRSGFLLKLFFGHRMSSERVRALLEGFRDEVERTHERLLEVVRLLEGPPEAYFVRATALMGARSAQTALQWVDEVRRGIPKPRRRTTPEGIVEDKARELFRKAPRRRTGGD